MREHEREHEGVVLIGCLEVLTLYLEVLIWVVSHLGVIREHEGDEVVGEDTEEVEPEPT